MLVFYAILSVVGIGVCVVFAKIFSGNLTILVSAVVLALLAPLPVYAIATTVAKNDQQTYHEYWGGFETAALSETDVCTRDGSCSNTYACDPYVVFETEYYTDSKGNSKSRTVTKTKYHSCPYSTEETTYYVETTIQPFVIDDNVMTGEPFRASTAIPGGQITEPPARWTQVKNRIEAGKPGPVSVVKDYKNYILASDRSLFKKYSNTIDGLKEDNLLPAPVSGITDYYLAPKAYFVGTNKIDTAVLAEQVAYLNAATATELQGDLHVVFVDAKKAGDGTDYTNSLQAYWQSKEFKKDALAKNAIVVVVGIDGYKTTQTATADTSSTPTDSTVADDAEKKVEPKAGTPIAKWVKAFTGMPLGNEALLTQIESELKNKTIDKDFIGHPDFNIAKKSITHSDGKLETILFGTNKFERISMTADDEGDNGSGFNYLAEEWEPDTGTMVGIYIVSGLLCLILLALGAFLSYTQSNPKNYGNSFPDPIKYMFSKKEKK